MRIPSASFCQSLTILSSFSSPIFVYMEKRGPEPSGRNSLSGVGFGAERGCSEHPIHEGKDGKNLGTSGKRTSYVPRLEVFRSTRGLRH